MGHDKDSLSDLERENTYAKVFEQFAFGKPSLSLPRLILIGGQPGAGKSRVAARAERELAAIGAPVAADIDDIRPLYPDVEDIFEEAPFQMSAITNFECWGWTSRLLLDARHSKNNVVYQATIRNAKRIDELIKEFQKDGFAVDLYTVAVHARQSVYGIFKRFEDAAYEYAIGGAAIPRWVPIPFHNQVYRVFPDSVDYLAENAHLERVGVFRRDGTKLYFSEDLLIHHGAGDSIIKERDHLWLPDERNAFAANWKELYQAIEARPEGKLKPKWYTDTAHLYYREAEWFQRASEIFNHEASTGMTIEHKTHNHVFVKSDSGDIHCYQRAVRTDLHKKAKSSSDLINLDHK